MTNREKEENYAIRIREEYSPKRESDIYDIASFITGTDGAKNRIALTHDALFNLTVRRPVEVIDLFDKPELNLISAIIRERPCEILLRGVSLSAPMNNTLRHIARVVVEQA